MHERNPEVPGPSAATDTAPVDRSTSTNGSRRDATRRGQILAAAARGFATAGYAATSVDAIAAEAGISKLVVYRHFGTKADLYRAVLGTTVTTLRDEVAERAARGEFFGLHARAFLAVARRDPDGFRLLWRHAAREPDFGDLVAAVRDGATAMTEALLSANLPDASFGRWHAETLLDHVVVATLNWLDDGDPADDERFVTDVTAALRATVAAWARRPDLLADALAAPDPDSFTSAANRPTTRLEPT